MLGQNWQVPTEDSQNSCCDLGSTKPASAKSWKAIQALLCSQLLDDDVCRCFFVTGGSLPKKQEERTGTDAIRCSAPIALPSSFQLQGTLLRDCSFHFCIDIRFFSLEAPQLADVKQPLRALPEHDYQQPCPQMMQQAHSTESHVASAAASFPRGA